MRRYNNILLPRLIDDFNLTHTGPPIKIEITKMQICRAISCGEAGCRLNYCERGKLGISLLLYRGRALICSLDLQHPIYDQTAPPAGRTPN